MDSIGLSPALGSFLAGVVLAGSEYRHEIQADIAPFKGLLLGLFFITVGASIDLGVIAAAPVRIFGLVLTLIVAKMLVLYLLARLFGLRGRDRMLFTFALAQAGEFGFFLAAFAGQSGVLTPEETARVLVIVSLSMFLTPVLFLIQERLPRRPPGGAEAAEAIEARGPVIVAGYGRFGRTVDRLLRVAGHATVVIDADRGVVSRMRALGLQAYFGEVERPDLLEAAGIAQAQALVIAIDDRAKALALARFVRKAYPQVRVIARARDQQHVLEYADLGVGDSVREVFDGAVLAGRHALAALGHEVGQIDTVARAFEAVDEELREELTKIWDRKLPLDHDPAHAARVKAADDAIRARLRAGRGAGEDAAEDRPGGVPAG
jgi:CPA2 family monovalent cation:H+ antiporter-2